ncbi:hypothetical protein CbuD7D7780_05940 [Coxiella burnetii]|uniref:hypothetical protein n=1 Tax=Coxiella burnetii TaxID=777 RepID=UPI0002FCAC2B|nr:hypothetical protein [Coxiella burnetii]OYK80295.1 hypothetical protein CbuD7E6568_05920 [Coxiella burnetii]OYK82377.1 hypothetical protein CbuD7D7780_05940 [Coxiella burnetii]
MKTTSSGYGKISPHAMNCVSDVLKQKEEGTSLLFEIFQRFIEEPNAYLHFFQENIELLSRSSVTEFLPPLIILTSSLFYLSEYYGDRFLGKTSKLKTYKMLDIFLG